MVGLREDRLRIVSRRRPPRAVARRTWRHDREGRRRHAAAIVGALDSRTSQPPTAGDDHGVVLRRGERQPRHRSGLAVSGTSVAVCLRSDAGGHPTDGDGRNAVNQSSAASHRRGLDRRRRRCHGPLQRQDRQSTHLRTCAGSTGDLRHQKRARSDRRGCCVGFFKESVDRRYRRRFEPKAEWPRRERSDQGCDGTQLDRRRDGLPAGVRSVRRAVFS